MSQSEPMTPLQARAIAVMYPHMTALEIGEVVGFSDRTVYAVASEAGLRKYGPDANAQRRSRMVSTVSLSVAASNRPIPDYQDPLAIVLTALEQALEALARGRHAEAQGHIKAGLAVAELAEVAAGLQAEGKSAAA